MAMRLRKLKPKAPLPGRPPPRIGHNRGPALDAVVSWRQVSWRKSHRRLWKRPPREVALRRGRRAAELGLSYRQFTAVLLDQAARIEALVFTARALLGADGRLRPGVADKLAGLRDCRLLLLTDTGAALAAKLEAAGRGIAAETLAAPADAAALHDWARRRGLVPATVAMIGDGAPERAPAQAAGFGLYLWHQAYFRTET